MSWRKKTFLTIFAMAMGMVLGTIACFLLSPDTAFAEYSNLDPHKALTASKDGTSPIYNGMADMLRAVTSGVLLPAGIVFFVWRTVYLAVFPLMLQIDPLAMTASERYSTGTSSGRGSGRGRMGRIAKGMFSKDGPSGTAASAVDAEMSKNNDKSGPKSWTAMQHGVKKAHELPAEAERCLKIELKMMFKGFLIVGLLWTIIQLVITGVGFFIQMAQTF